MSISRIRFTQKPARAGRRHFLTRDDVRVLLGRLPAELWERLRHVHFNDRAWGNRVLGYVTHGYREITVCALPAQISLGRMCQKHRFPAARFGAPARGIWPMLAVRRYLLYNTFLHELGHLQIVNQSARSERLRFARERRAQEFANRWRGELWSEHFDHPDPVHNPPQTDGLQREQETSAAVAP